MQSTQLRKEIESLKLMRHRINQSDDMARLDATRSKDNLKKLKQDDLDKFMNNKSKTRDEERQFDRDYVSSKVAVDEQNLRAESHKKEVNHVLTRPVVILLKTPSSIRFYRRIKSRLLLHSSSQR